ncbi:MAG TPA: bifunctional UDP-N-acetylglucosamine diphosphorylase/glucosamine-1-phosphate N-acetyltransferase GlmU [Candidatus Babeliales bacterium]|nr:bifunctional UDP-N-acetylglucosamine diphosphorylase/glucosamine-1-phosphate N-acetyltransferase GlmU [Candidatus Babeliales bacterium]
MKITYYVCAIVSLIITTTVHAYKNFNNLEKFSERNAMNPSIQAIILAAGKSTRFHTEKTKLAETICGQTMILFPTKLLAELKIPTTVVVGYQKEIIQNIITTEHGDIIDFVVQEKQNGTGHALACTKQLWEKEHILVMNGDVPLVTPETIASLCEEHLQSNAAISFVTSCNPDETGKSYGRIVETTHSIAIVEAKDFTGDAHEHCCINAGIYLINTNFLQNYIATLDDNNANKEFYITDLVKIASENNLVVATTKAPFDTIRGINTFQELWAVEQIKRSELIKYWMDQGVRFSLPHHVHLDLNVTIGQGSYIGGGVHLRGNTVVGKDCIIQEFSSLENVIIEDNVTIHSCCIINNTYIQSGAHVGPFAHLRSNVTIGANSAIGNFVEVKNSTIGVNTKAKHLTYIGDATIGSQVNIGAGTITCNYDGVNKHKTIIEDHAFIGSNNTLVAPITIGHNTFTAAGSTLTADVPDNALAIARAHQTNKYDYAKKLKNKSIGQKIISDKLDDFSFLGARLIHPDNSADEQ